MDARLLTRVSINSGAVIKAVESASDSVAEGSTTALKNAFSEGEPVRGSMMWP